MLTVTITSFNPEYHLLALASLFLLWRLSELLAMPEPDILYTSSMILIQITAIFLALITKKRMNASTDSD